MSTQPSEAHRKLAAEILFTYSVSGAARPSAIVAAAQLLRDSEARAVEAALVEAHKEINKLNEEAERQTRAIILLKQHGDFTRDRYTGFGPNAYDCRCCGAILNGGDRLHHHDCELADIIGKKKREKR